MNSLKPIIDVPNWLEPTPQWKRERQQFSRFLIMRCPAWLVSRLPAKLEFLLGFIGTVGCTNRSWRGWPAGSHRRLSADTSCSCRRPPCCAHEPTATPGSLLYAGPLYLSPCEWVTCHSLSYTTLSAYRILSVVFISLE